MKKKGTVKRVVVGVLVLALCVTGILAATGAFGTSEMYSLGSYQKQFRQTRENELQGTGERDVVASYKDFKVRKSSIEYAKKTDAMREEPIYKDEQDIIDQLIIGQLLLEEADRRGIKASAEEVEDVLDQTEETYATPDGKQWIDDYCAGAGLTYEEYLNMLRDQVPRTITRRKVRDAIGQDYCKEHDIEFTKVNQPQEMVDAVNAYIDGLLEAAQPEIVYYSRNGEQTQ